MATQLTAADARQSLTSHLTAKGSDVFVQYGGQLAGPALARLLADRGQVRYPCALAFDAGPLEPGEFAYAQPLGAHPEDGFTVHVHPCLAPNAAAVAAVVLYHLVTVNYGGFASADDAETYGAAALGLTRDEYYARLCTYADRVPGASRSP